MSPGIGKTQQAILEELNAGHLAVADLAERLGVGDHEIRRAVHALDTYADLFDDDLDAVATALHARYSKHEGLAAHHH